MTNKKIPLKRSVIILLTSLTAAASLISAAVIAGLCSIVTLLISSVFFGVIFYFCLRSSRLSDIILKYILSGAFAFVLFKFIWDNDLFYKLFLRKFYEYGAPNAGTGFTVLVSFGINIFTSIVIFLVLFLVKWLKPNSNN